MSNPINPESITLRALDRLPPTAAHEAEAAIAEDPELARQLREVEDIAAHLWQASSPLHSAPPEIWEHLEGKLRPTANARRVGLARTAVLALGWAAALVLLLVLLLRNDPKGEPAVGSPGSPLAGKSDAPHSPPLEPGMLPPKSPAQDRALSPAERKLRAQLHDLRARLARLQDDPSNANRPTIVALHPPGTVIASDGRTTSARVLSLITSALSDDLQRRQEEETDLVIERGWKPELFQGMTDDMVIRHRSFLEAVDEGEFLVSDDGRYYDSTSSLVWSPAPDGGGFLGQRAQADLDLSRFEELPPKDDPPSKDLAIASAPPDPSGYVIQDPVTNEATLLVDEIPPQPEGAALRIRFLDSSGQQVEIPVPLAGSSFTNTGLAIGSALSISLGAGFNPGSAFQFSSILPDGSSNVLLSNQPGR